MHAPRPLALFLILTAGLCFAAGRACVAGEMKFPDKTPLVSFTFPDKWRVEHASKAGQLPRLRVP